MADSVVVLPHVSKHLQNVYGRAGRHDRLLLAEDARESGIAGPGLTVTVAGDATATLTNFQVGVSRVVQVPAG